MRGIRLFCYPILIVLGLVQSLALMAQGQDSKFKWIGNTVSTVMTSTDHDVKTFYLYNVGSGKYLNTGSYWGTSISAFKVGMPLVITKNANGTYKIQGPISTESGKYLGFPSLGASDGEKQFDWDRIYCDRGVKTPDQDHCDWVITDVSRDGKTYYTLYIDNGTNSVIGGKRYLSVTTNADTKRNEINYPTSVNTTDENCLWQIVTLKDLKDAFKEQFASNETPADATFLIADQNFDISNADVVKWVRTGLTSKENVGAYAHAFSPEASYSFFVGNRGIMADKYQRHYGKYWIGSIRNVGHDENANGTMTQSVKTLKKGWYRVSCDGFYNADNGSDISASLFAKVQNSNDGKSNVSTTLNYLYGEISYSVDDLTKTSTKHNGLDINDISPYIKAAQLFEKNTYNNSILVYVPNDGDILDIGIKVENSTGDLDWTAFDNFQLQYCGNNDMILDEAQTSVDYMEKQTNPNNAYTLILKRTMTPGLWNSITLPVSLTAAQFKTAFGDQAKLSKLKGQDESIPSRIDFETVSLTNDDDVVIEPSKLYIMKPTRSANVTDGSYSKIIETGNTITVQAPYYTINNVTLKTAPTATFKENAKISTTVDQKLQFCGTQIKQTTNIVPANSYVLGAKDGKWHFTQHSLPINGFRCWIATSSDVQAKTISFFIDGVEEGYITAIDQNVINTSETPSGTVYNVNGQVVRRNATSVEGLPKGIYIMNNKKYIVK